MKLQSTRSTRSATTPLKAKCQPQKYFNPRAPHGARLCCAVHYAIRAKTSIHALHTERDLTSLAGLPEVEELQSTRSTRSATMYPRVGIGRTKLQSTRSTRSATSRAPSHATAEYTSIHALHTEREAVSP